MHQAGVSVRRVEDITEVLWGTRVSAGTVSRLNQRGYERIEQWRNEPLTELFPYVYLDGIVLSHRKTLADEIGEGSGERSREYRGDAHLQQFSGDALAPDQNE